MTKDGGCKIYKVQVFSLALKICGPMFLEHNSIYSFNVPETMVAEFDVLSGGPKSCRIPLLSFHVVKDPVFVRASICTTDSENFTRFFFATLFS